jgi:hypothetical protein
MWMPRVMVADGVEYEDGIDIDPLLDPLGAIVPRAVTDADGIALGVIAPRAVIDGALPLLAGAGEIEPRAVMLGVLVGRIAVPAGVNRRPPPPPLPRLLMLRSR